MYWHVRRLRYPTAYYCIVISNTWAVLLLYRGYVSLLCPSAFRLPCPEVSIRDAVCQGIPFVIWLDERDNRPFVAPPPPGPPAHHTTDEAPIIYHRPQHKLQCRFQWPLACDNQDVSSSVYTITSPHRRGYVLFLTWRLLSFSWLCWIARSPLGLERPNLKCLDQLGKVCVLCLALHATWTLALAPWKKNPTKSKTDKIPQHRLSLESFQGGKLHWGSRGSCLG